VSLRDHFFPEDLTIEELWSASHRELGDFATNPYTLEMGKNSAILSRLGQVRCPDPRQVLVRKEITLREGDSVVEIRYDIENKSEQAFRALFGVEFCVNLLTGSSFDRYYRSDDRDMNYTKLGERGCDMNLSHLALRDDWQRIECGFRFDTPARVYRFAIETVSQSEGGQERVYQASVVTPCWIVNCEPGQTVTRIIRAEAAQSA
jgi:alpha-amylase